LRLGGDDVEGRSLSSVVTDATEPEVLLGELHLGPGRLDLRMGEAGPRHRVLVVPREGALVAFPGGLHLLGLELELAGGVLAGGPVEDGDVEGDEGRPAPVVAVEAQGVDPV